MLESLDLEHVILLIYILIFSSGLSGILSLLLLKLRYKNSVILNPLIILECLFTLGLLLVGIYFYTGNIIDPAPREGRSLELVFGGITSIVSLLLYLQLILIMKGISEEKEKRGTLYRSAVIFSIFSGVLIIAGLAINLSPISVVYNTYRLIISPATYLCMSLAVSLFGFVLLRARLSREPSLFRFLLKGLGICCLTFLPLSVLEFYLEFLEVNIYRPLSLDFLFYLGCNGVFLSAGIKALKSKTEAGYANLCLSREMVDIFKLTDRECDMVRMIAGGLSNKEIAFQLNISPATVRSHIYNLYQKVKVQSRVELLNKISSL